MELTIQNRISTAYLIDNDIVCVEYQPNATSTYKDVQESYQSYLALSEGKRLRKLTVIGKSTFFDASMRCSIEKEIQPIAEAFVSDSLAIRLTLQNCERLLHSQHPWQLFKTESEAIAWLRSID